MRRTKYEFVVLEFHPTEEGNRVLQHSSCYLRDHVEAGETAEEISGQFYDVDEEGNQTGTPVIVVTLLNGSVMLMTLPLAKAAQMRGAAVRGGAR